MQFEAFVVFVFLVLVPVALLVEPLALILHNDTVGLVSVLVDCNIVEGFVGLNKVDLSALGTAGMNVAAVPAEIAAGSFESEGSQHLQQW